MDTALFGKLPLWALLLVLSVALLFCNIFIVSFDEPPKGVYLVVRSASSLSCTGPRTRRLRHLRSLDLRHCQRARLPPQRHRTHAQHLARHPWTHYPRLGQLARRHRGGRELGGAGLLADGDGRCVRLWGWVREVMSSAHVQYADRYGICADDQLRENVGCGGWM